MYKIKEVDNVTYMYMYMFMYMYMCFNNMYN